MAKHTHQNLFRLLRSCERLSTELHGHAERKRFEAYLVVLESLWHQLADQQRDNHADPSGSSAIAGEGILGEYRRKIERLAELIDAEKMRTGSGSGLALTQASCNASLTREQANAELSSRLRTASREQDKLRNKLLAGQEAAGVADCDQATAPLSEVLPAARPTGGSSGCAVCASASASSPGPPAALRSTGSARLPFGGAGAAGVAARQTGGTGVEKEALRQTLAEQREMHDQLLTDLAQSVGELRGRSLQARQAMRDDCQTLDATSSQLDSNRSKMNANNSKLRQALKSMRSSTCMICMMFLVVCTLFVFTFFLIRLVPKRPTPPSLSQGTQGAG
jgi:hypothetical protein